MFDYIELKVLLTSFAIKLYLITFNYFQWDQTSFLHIELLLITMNQWIWLIFITFNYIELL